MKDFPKVLATAADVRNCKALVESGSLHSSDLLNAINALENQNYINCPVKELSDDRKTVTINYCAEAVKGTKILANGTEASISIVTHVEGEAKDDGSKQFETTVLTLSKAISTDTTVIGISNAVSIYAEIGMDKAEMDAIKEELSNE